VDVPNVGTIRVEPDGKTSTTGPPQEFKKDSYKQFPF
jgi:hypothetical protein